MTVSAWGTIATSITRGPLNTKIDVKEQQIRSKKTILNTNVVFNYQRKVGSITKVAVRFETWGGGGGGEGAHLPPDHKQTPPQILKNALCCSLAQAIFTVSSVPVIDLSQYTISHLFRLSADLWCFLGSPWVIWGQKMFALKSPMSQVLSNISVKVFLATKTRGATDPLLLYSASHEF